MMVRNKTTEETVLFVSYVSDQLRTFGLPENFDISDSVTRLREGQSFYDLVGEDVMHNIGDIYTVGHLMFSKGNVNGAVWEYREKSQEVFPETPRIMLGGQLEEILNRTHKMRKMNKWIPFINLTIPNAERLCDPDYGQFCEDFIRNAVLNNAENEKFYVNIPYWSAYRAVKKDDLVLPVQQFIKPADYTIENSPFYI